MPRWLFSEFAGNVARAAGYDIYKSPLKEEVLDLIQSFERCVEELIIERGIPESALERSDDDFGMRVILETPTELVVRDTMEEGRPTRDKTNGK